MKNDDENEYERTLAEFAIEIARLEVTELLTLSNSAIINFSDGEARLALYAKYIEWDRRVSLAFLRDPQFLDYYNDWMAIKFFQPRNRPYKFPDPINKYADDPKLNHEVGEARDQIIGDLNGLNAIIGEKVVILRRFEAAQRSSDSERAPKGKIKLEDKTIKFDDQGARILIGEIPVPLPPFQNEHYLCRAAFKREVHESVDWSLIYKEMTGDREEVADKKKMRTVQDAMYALNNRVKKEANTDDGLFSWENKSMARNF